MNRTKATWAVLSATAIIAALMAGSTRAPAAT